MAWIIKIDDEYYIEYMAQGLKFQKKAGKDAILAEKLLSEIKGSLPDIKTMYTVREDVFDDFIERFLKYAQDVHTVASYLRYQSTLKHFAQYISPLLSTEKKMKEITPDIMNKYRFFLSEKVSSKEIKVHTANFTLYLLRDIFDYAIKIGSLNDNPTAHMKFFKNSTFIPIDILKEPELKIILKTASSELKEILEFCLWTGLRPETIIKLKWEQVEDGCLNVGILKSYNGQNIVHSIPLEARINNILSQKKALNNSNSFIFTNQDGKELSDLDIKMQLEKVFQQIGLQGTINSRILQNTFVIHLFSRGVTLSLVYRLLGLNDIARIVRYLDYYIEYL